MPDSFVFILAGEAQDDGGRTYDTAIDALVTSPTDLIFVETGVTTRVESSGGAATISEDDLVDIQNADVDGDGTRHVFGYVNLGITDQYRAYWDLSWTLDTDGTAFTTFDPEINHDVAPLNPSNDAVTEGWLTDTFGTAFGPPEDGSTEDTEYGRIVDFRSGGPSDPNANDIAAEGTWWDIVLDQVEALFHYGYRDFFLDDVGRYFEAAENSGVPLAELGDAMIELVNAVDAHLTGLAVAEGINPNDVTLAINGGGYLRWNNSFGQDSDTLDTFFGAIDYLVSENLFLGSPQALVEIGRNLAGTNTTLLSIEWGNTVPDELAGTYFALLEAITQATGTATIAHTPEIPDYEVLDGGTLPPDTLVNGAVAPTHTAIIAPDVFGTTIYGTDGDDIIFATSGADTIYAGAGDDIIYGLGGDDIVYGEDGADIIIAGDGSDMVSGGAGDDWIYGGNVPDGVSVWDLIT